MFNVKKAVIYISVVFAILVITLIAGSFYMLHYSLASNPLRLDTERGYKELFANYPETIEWMDSLRRNNALHDTIVSMPEGYRCHAYYIMKGSNRTALVIHGWRDMPIKYFYLARMYEREFGYNVIIPDVYAHGKSDGDVIRMGWLDRLDMLRWIEIFKTDTMVVHGVSMGGAMTMMLSGEKMPSGIKDIRFVDYCGYTSVWDEFAGELKNQFGLHEFPLMYTTSLLCSIMYGWNFDEASAINQVRKCHYPMLFIHGDSDTFVPTEMVYRLFSAKRGPKELWITKNTDHAHSYLNHREDYILHLKKFLNL